MTDFKPGDKVIDKYNDGSAYTIVRGPFPAYLTREDGGESQVVFADRLEAADPRVDVVAAAIAGVSFPEAHFGELTYQIQENYRVSARAVLAALGETLTAPDRTLRDGDKLRITRVCSPDTNLIQGDIVTVIRAEPDADDDIRVRDVLGQRWCLPATGDDKGWEHV